MAGNISPIKIQKNHGLQKLTNTISLSLIAFGYGVAQANNEKFQLG